MRRDVDAKRRAERRITREQGAIVAVTAAAAVVVSDAEQWDRPELLLLLLAIALGTDRLAVDIGQVRVSMVDAGVVLAAILAGPAPGMLIGVLVMLADGALTKLPRHVLTANLAANAAPAIVVGLMVQTAVEQGWAEPGGGWYIVVVAAASALFKATNLSLLVYARGIAGYPRREQVRQIIVPLIPWEAVSAAMIAATAHVYVTVGIEAVLGLVVVLGFFRLLLDTIAAAERRQREIASIAAERERYLQEALAAEERERTRIAAELHDETLQTLLSARADLADGLQGDTDRFADARDAVTAAVGSLRDLMVRLGPAPGTDGDIAGVVHGLAERIGRRAGFQAAVDVDHALAESSDPLVVGVVRELLVNVAKHARATHVDVHVRMAEGDVHVEVSDDGVGFDDAQRARAVADGHIGLALLEQRAAARAGRLEIAPRPGGGTVACVTLRAESRLSPA